jgi:hypothetical protein
MDECLILEQPTPETYCIFSKLRRFAFARAALTDEVRRNEYIGYAACLTVNLMRLIPQKGKRVLTVVFSMHGFLGADVSNLRLVR